MTAIASLMLLIVFDQMRLQPWIYQYFLVLVIFALKKDELDSDQTLGLVQILLAALYFWSGLQKLNYSFSHEVLPKLLESIFPEIGLPFLFIGIAIALIEILIGIGLVFRQTRKIAVFSAVITHTAILLLLIAINYNRIIWIWNIALILLVFTAFWKSEISFKQTFQSAADRKIKFAKAVVAAIVLLPVLSFFGLWDMYLSGALYSGNTEIAVIRVDEKSLGKLPLTAQKTVFQTKKDDEKMLPLLEWSIAELNVPVYPEKRIFRQIFYKVCKLSGNSNFVELIIKNRPAIFDGSYKIDRSLCRQL